MSESPKDVSQVIAEAAELSLSTLLGDAPPKADESVVPDADTPDVSLTPSEDAESTPPSDEAPAEDAAPAALPAGYVAVPTVTEGLATEFAVFDPEGAVEVPALEVEYKANGKVRRDRLDQVVKLAQMGVYNYERDIARQREVEQAIHTTESELRERDVAIQQLLEDPDTYLAARERYLSENTPEVRAQRLAQENASLKSAEQQRAMARDAQRFYEAEIVPSLKVLTQALPEVGEEEVASYLATAVMPLMENGLVPPKHYDTIRRYVVHELTPFVQDLNAKRAAKMQQAAQTVSAKATAAQVAAQKAKREVGKVVKPSARTMSGQFASPKRSSKPNSVDDAVEDALENVLQGLA